MSILPCKSLFTPLESGHTLPTTLSSIRDVIGSIINPNPSPEPPIGSRAKYVTLPNVTAYARLERRSSLLEAPRFEAMMRLSTCERESSIATEEALATDSSRREKLRSMFTSAITEWSTTAGATSIPMAAALRARAEATAELWAAGGRAMKKVSPALFHGGLSESTEAGLSVPCFKPRQRGRGR